MKIKICKKFSKVAKLRNRLSTAFPNDTISVKKCIDMCKNCKHQPTAKVRNKKFKASRISKLIEKIKTKY